MLKKNKARGRQSSLGKCEKCSHRGRWGSNARKSMELRRTKDTNHWGGWIPKT